MFVADSMLGGLWDSHASPLQRAAEPPSVVVPPASFPAGLTLDGSHNTFAGGSTPYDYSGGGTPSPYNFAGAPHYDYAGSHDAGCWSVGGGSPGRSSGPSVLPPPVLGQLFTEPTHTRDPSMGGLGPQSADSTHTRDPTHTRNPTHTQNPTHKRDPNASDPTHTRDPSLGVLGQQRALAPASESRCWAAMASIPGQPQLARPAAPAAAPTAPGRTVPLTPSQDVAQVQFCTRCVYMYICMYLYRVNPIIHQCTRCRYM